MAAFNAIATGTKKASPDSGDALLSGRRTYFFCAAAYAALYFSRSCHVASRRSRATF